METFPEDPFETVKARIVSGDERQVVEFYVIITNGREDRSDTLPGPADEHY